jgi:restriction endonuclease NaeI
MHTRPVCSDPEKADLGITIENIVRGKYNLHEGPSGTDFDVKGVDVDCKWSRTWGKWMKPPEAVGYACLLVYGDDVNEGYGSRSAGCQRRSHRWPEL